MNRSFLVLALLASSVGASVPGHAQAPAEDLYEKLKMYDFQTRTPVQTLYNQIQTANKAQKADIEKHLIGVLEDPAATFGGKQEACRMLWIIGTAQSVPALTKMLADVKLSDPARYALERNPDPTAAAALRTALTTSQGKIQIGILNSIGDRGDADAVPLLKTYTTANDPLLAEAAITALGKIGTPAAFNVLKALPATRPLVGKAMLRCAATDVANGKASNAIKTYTTLIGAKYPSVVRVEALRGLTTLSAPGAGATALTFLKPGNDSYVQVAAARIAGSMPDPKVTSQLIALWPALPIDAQTVALVALADRREATAAPLAATASQSQDQGLRTAGIQAVARIGGAKAVTILTDIALHGQGGDRGTARQGLASITGADVDKALLEQGKQGTPEVRTLLIEVLTERPGAATIAFLSEVATGSDPKLAITAVRALGKVGTFAESALLLKLLTTTSNGQVRDTARDAIAAIGRQANNSDRMAAAVLAAFPNASNSGKAGLLPLLAEIGGERSLTELSNAASSSDADLKQAAVGALAETWNDTNALPVLLKIAKSDADKSTRIQALRGYFRLIGQEERTPGAQKVQQLADGMAVAERPEEKKQALSFLRDCRVGQAVELASKALDDPATFSDAADTILYLAAPQRKNNRNQPPVRGRATNAALDKIIQLTKDDNQKALAQKLKA